MELSLFLAQLFGLTLVIFAGLAFWRPELVTAAVRDMKPFSFPMLLAGFIGVFGGLAIILAHNIWEFNWRVVITLLGWVALIKGVFYVAFPETIMLTGVRALEGKRQRVVLFLAFLFGCYLVYCGFSFGR